MEGRLLFGIPYQGMLHFDIKVKLLSLAGECHALELLEDLGLPEPLPLSEQEEKIASEERLNPLSRMETLLSELVFISQQLEIVGIPQAVLTPQFLLDNLTPADYVLIWGLLDNLRKKRIEDGGNLSPQMENPV
ncbi:hypothetical protein ACLSYX_10480 [[Pasteurella] aerogenes]